MAILIHLYEHSLPVTDYRYQNQTNFVQKKNLLSLDLDLGKASTHDFGFDDSCKAFADENFLVQFKTIYIAISCFQLQTCRKFISLLCTYLTAALQSRDQEESIELVLLEDLFYIERAYIYSPPHTKFLAYFETTSNQHEFGFLTGRLSSTNEELNVYGEGDVYTVPIPEIQSHHTHYFTSLLEHVSFKEMFNQGHPVPRLVAEEYIEHPELGVPVYRHPHDSTPSSMGMHPIVQEICMHIYTHIPHLENRLNHALIQHYRDGSDTIAAHSDKTLDIHPHTPILNVSIGSTRYMYLQHKKHKYIVQKLPLRHGEVVVFGLDTNRHWFHEIPKLIPTPHHDVYGTSRISLTYRAICTFDSRYGVLIGQGSVYKTLQDYMQVRDGGVAVG
ncbi:hypothetical protein EON63_18915, partial [archaeon]